MSDPASQPIHIREAQKLPDLVTARVDTDLAVVELCAFPEVAAQTIVVAESESVLALGLSALLPNAEGRFHAGAPARFARFGPLSFRPAGIPLEMRVTSGAFRTIRCRFKDDRLAQFAPGEEWAEAEIAACFDIRSPAIEDAMLRLAEEADDPRSDTGQLAQALVQCILVDLARYLAHARQLGLRRSGGLAPRRLREVLARIEATGPPPSIDQLAALCGISRFHFMHAFRATMGSSAGAYIQDARMRRAKNLLASGDQPVAAVASELGYRSAASFAAAFTKAAGRSPSAYRSVFRS